MIDNENSEHAFCFQCTGEQPGYRRIEPSTFYNPLPDILADGALGYMRVQPLARIVYSPVPRSTFQPLGWEGVDKKFGPGYVAYMRDWFNSAHEAGHLLFLDQTPAKDLARRYLAESYAALQRLMFSSGLSDRELDLIQSDFVAYSNQLDNVHRCLNYTEELFSTSLAVAAMRHEITPGHMWSAYVAEAEELEIKTVAAEKKRLLGFSQYYERMVRLAQLIRQDNRGVLGSWVSVMIQPIPPAELNSLIAGHAYQLDHLNWLLDAVESSEDIEEIRQVLAQRSPDIAASWIRELTAHIEILRADAECAGESVGWTQLMLENLWEVSRGLPQLSDSAAVEADRAAHNSFSRIIDGKRTDRSWRECCTIVSPHYEGAYTGIRWQMTGPNERAKARALGSVLLMEALREQALSMRGFRCPLRRDVSNRCECSKSFRDGLTRLVDVARDGVFGPGEWSTPMCLEN